MGEWNEAIEAAARRIEERVIDETGPDWGLASPDHRRIIMLKNTITSAIAESVRGLKRGEG